MNLNLTAGQSLRDLADQLGVPVEELKPHADVEDVEAPVQIDKSFEIPDGFFRQRDRDRRSIMEAVPKTTAHGGLNAVMALNIEYQRTRIAGGMKTSEAPDPEEVEGLAEAERAYWRLEPDSHELAIDLWAQLDKSKNITIRAEAYARQAIALAQRHIIYGATARKCRVAALSAAKAALMADPKLPAAHLGMALGLKIGGSTDDLAEARDHVERAIELDPDYPWTWVEYATLLRAGGERESAREASEVALEIVPEGVPALEIAGVLALDDGDGERAEQLFVELLQIAPDYAVGHARLATALKKNGRRDEAKKALDKAKSLAIREEHRLHLDTLYTDVGI